MMYGFGGHGWGMGLAWLAGLIFIILVVWLVNTLVVNQNKRQYANIGKSALEILKERYAKGEISKEEFEEKKHEIS